jgi:hypothetical protein
MEFSLEEVMFPQVSVPLPFVVDQPVEFPLKFQLLSLFNASVFCISDGIRGLFQTGGQEARSQESINEIARIDRKAFLTFPSYHKSGISPIF